MARYLKTAAEANAVARDLIELVPAEDRPKAAEMIARLVNLGVRCSPRGVQSLSKEGLIQALRAFVDPWDKGGEWQKHITYDTFNKARSLLQRSKP